MQILILGAGKVGTNLARLAHAHELSVTLWNNVPPPKSILDAVASSPRIALLWEKAPDIQPDLVLLAVPEAHISTAAETVLAWPGMDAPPIAQTSGSYGLTTVNKTPIGICHPAFSFPTPELDLDRLAHMAVLVSGPEKTCAACRLFLEQCRVTALQAPSVNAMLYHAGCITAANLVALLGVEAEQLMAEAGLPREGAHSLLSSLMHSVLSQAEGSSFRKSLTGPAARGDYRTVIREALAVADTQSQFAGLFLQGNLRIAKHRGQEKFIQEIQELLGQTD